VYVPAPGAQLPARPGSAIVGPDTDTGRICIDFEDGRYTPAPYVELVARAAGRHRDRHPTVARAFVDRDAVVAIGWFDAGEGIVVVEDAERLTAWHPGALSELVSLTGPAARRREFERFLETRPEIAANPALRQALARQLRIAE
jgi:hypothetical protein